MFKTKLKTVHVLNDRDMSFLQSEKFQMVFYMYSMRRERKRGNCLLYGSNFEYKKYMFMPFHAWHTCIRLHGSALQSTWRDMPRHAMPCHDTTWHHMTSHHMTWHAMTRHDRTSLYITWHQTTSHRMNIWHDMHDMTWHDITWHEMTRHDTTWRLMTSHHMTCHDTTRHDITLHHMTSEDIRKHQITWHDMHEMTWHDMTWQHTKLHCISINLLCFTSRCFH